MSEFRRAVATKRANDGARRMPEFFDTNEQLRKLGMLGDRRKVNENFNDSEALVSAFISAVLAFV